jgi:predicted phosphodiesterase
MRIGLASDSYGNVDDLARALERFVAAGVDRIFFLGGRFADVDAAVARMKFGTGQAPVAAPGADPFLAAFRGALAAHVSGDEEARTKLRQRIVRVASRACPEYESGSAPRKVMDLLEGHVACLVHDKSELSRDDITNAVLLFHGNSAQAAVVQIGPRCFVKPGHLRTPAPDGRPASTAVLELEPRALTLVVHDMAGQELRRERADLGGRSKMVVR